MKISKKDALLWFKFFCEYPPEEIPPKQEEIIYSVFSQIEEAVMAKREAFACEIKGLCSLEGRSFFVGDEKKFSPGCRSCLLGTGLSAIRKTNKCNLSCKFCYDYGQMNSQPPIGEGLWEIGGTRFYERDLPLLFSMGNRPTGVAYVYLEPFMEIEKYYSIIKKFSQENIYQHMYTNGTLATEENLKALGEAGLNELRFNLGASAVSEKVINAMAIAKKYIPSVGIETPMTREFYAEFEKKKQKILQTNLDFMNLAEVHLNENNIANFAGESMYITHMGYISPIVSGDIALQIMKEASLEGWEPAVHFCSNLTKFARDLNLASHEGGWFGKSGYGMEFDYIPFEYFLPTLEDEDFYFLEEQSLPKGYGFGDVVL